MPLHYTPRQGVSGVVVDEATRSPIASVKVVVKSDKSEARAFSDTHGRFEVPADRTWGLFIVGMAAFPPIPWTVTFSAAAYEDHVVSDKHTLSSPGIRFLGEVPLRRSQTPNKAPEPTPGAVTPRATEGTSK